MNPLFQRRNQVLTIQQPNAYPIIKVDPTRLTQVLVNLLSNASKYSPLDAQIGLDIEVHSGDLVAQVTDEGRGVSVTEEQTLFRRFARSDDQDDPQYGIGLGLFVVKTIVEEHGGEVGVDSRPAGGSVFWFRIPIEGNLQ